MATGRHRIARGKMVYIYPDRTIKFNPGDSVPPIIELDRAAEALEGGPVFEGTDVPVEYVHYYLDNDHSLHVFLHDYPSVSRRQALAAIEERLLERIDNLINSDREFVSGKPRFNGTRIPAGTLFTHLTESHGIEEFLSDYYMSVAKEQALEIVQVAKLLVEFYAYRIAFERMDINQ